MLTILWAFGSMLVLMLIISFLPLGYTKKGEIIIVLTGLLIALGGIAAVTSFPLWQTLLMILALSFFAAYFMDSRIGKTIYEVKAEIGAENEIDEFDSVFAMNSQIENTSDIELMDFSEVEISNTSINKIAQANDEDVLPLGQPSLANTVQLAEESDNEEIVDDSELEVSSLKDIDSLLEDGQIETLELEETGWLNELEVLSVIDQAQAPVNDNNVRAEDECEDLELFVVKEPLSVNLEEENRLEKVESGWLDELAELSFIDSVKDKDNDTNTIQEDEFDDFELEELFADKEVAVGHDKDKDEKEPLKELNLQK